MVRPFQAVLGHFGPFDVKWQRPCRPRASLGISWTAQGSKETQQTVAATLAESLLSQDNRPKVIADCFTLIEQEVSAMSGITGTAVKIAYKTVNAFMPGHVRFMVGSLLPDMIGKLEPYWADFGSARGDQFGDYLAQRGEDVAEALLSVTDARAAASGRPTIIKAYGAVRKGAVRHVEAALPRVGDLVMKYAA
jgi:hypothetical protein